ncbi:polyprenyl synthetase family protein [Thermohalobacter berrensis]|uniref:Farnesyl diphosphate synthase n=1 Tax=Thermohalobacter berrensis TaxID=99594 RepID=A0A419TAP7_9FIRM|nr:farnesyl diphosphate synthase [Thermohalobacter berrensis]RKD34564.1 farnesyl-diphosphate synthase [Thermohalobacter berrensis]
MELKREIEKYKKIIEDNIDKILPKSNNKYQSKVFDSMRYSIFAGGKRLRPILTLKTCELISGDYKPAIPFALAIEMIHTYSLIHDDLPAMDDDNYRRGKLTNHRVYGEAMAILAGDGLLNFAYEVMNEAILENNKDNHRLIKAFSKIATAAGVYGMIGGQVVDILSENTKIDADTLDFIHKHKTSALIEASIVSGAIIGGASDNEINALEKYGKSIGLGFQIRDDILDTIGDMKKLGKDIGSDEEKNKSTYISLYGLENSINKTKELCEEAINSLSIFNQKDISFFVELAKYLVNRDY